MSIYWGRRGEGQEARGRRKPELTELYITHFRTSM